jgi:hypothetical protein
MRNIKAGVVSYDKIRIYKRARSIIINNIIVKKNNKELIIILI